MGIITALLKKKITFQRLSEKNVIGYEIWGMFKDDTYDSGIRNDLLEIIDNPSEPNPVIKRISLEGNENATWKLPNDAFLDRDHQFRLYINDVIVSSLCYNYNRISRLITLDTVLREYSLSDDKVELEYYQDLIIKEYMLEDNCEIFVKPVFTQSYTYGDHNVIM